MECGARGPALGHVHDHVGGANQQDHGNCPCKECGLTPHRWLDLVRGIPDPVEPKMRTKSARDDQVVVLPTELRIRLTRYVAAVENRRGYR